MKDILDMYREGKATKEDVLKELSTPIIKTKHANIDNHRSVRRGFPEVIYCKEKTPEQVREIFLAMKGDIIMATKASPEHYEPLMGHAEYEPVSKIIYKLNRKVEKAGKVLVVSAGTSDLSIAEEAALTAELSGSNVVRKYDIGVAGIHRLMSITEELEGTDVIIAVAGMEGALPTVVSGLSRCPVIAVPTSVGYGASFEGIAPLLTMLNSCSPGIAVVNIDNGFGAGYLASMIR